MSKIGILGCGAFGLALAKICNDNHHEITLWTKFKEECDTLSKNHVNTSALPDYEIPDNFKITTNLEKTIKDNEIIIVAIPVPFLNDTYKEISKYNIKGKYFVIASKGIDTNIGKLPYEIFNKNLDTHKYAFISGPSFAVDITDDNLVGLSLASNDNETLDYVYEKLITDKVILHKTNDVIGLELCAAIKNVMAIASGMFNGFSISASTEALFMTNLFRDYTDIINILGGNGATTLTIGGFGDFYLTCNSLLSRNFTFGKLLSQNKKEALEFLNTHTVEGVHTLKTIKEILDNKELNNKLIDLLYNIIYKNNDAIEILKYK